MKKFIILLAGILLSSWTIGQTIQNGQNGSNYTTIDQLSSTEQLRTDQNISQDQNALIETYQNEIWVIEFTSDSTFVITEGTNDITDNDGNEIIIPKAMVTQAVLKGLIEAYSSDSSQTSIKMLEAKIGKSIHQIAHTRNLDMLMYTEHSFGNKSGNSEYKLLEDMVKSSDFDIMSNEKEFYKELDNMISGILVNVIFKPEDEILPTLQERLEELQFQQGVLNSSMSEHLFRTQIGN